MKTFIVISVLLCVPIYLMACALIRDFCNNRDQKPRVITIVKSQDDSHIVGECGWFDLPEITRPSERMRRLREIEPRGA